MKNYQTVSIQFTKSDADKLTEKAKQNRCKYKIKKGTTFL